METKERKAKGIWIPIEIWEDKNLSWKEKILLLEIDSFTTNNEDCFFSDQYISELLSISVTNANKTLSSLIQKGYVVKTRFDGRRRYIRTALSFSIEQSCQKQQGGLVENDNPTLSKTSSQGCQKRQGGLVENDNHNNIDIINNIINKENNICNANALTSSGDDDAPFDCEKFADFFNKTIDETGSKIPHIIKIDKRRRSKLEARVITFGAAAVYECVKKAVASLFLNGGGNKGWIATFDWLFGPDNFKKVLEGNYDNRNVQGMETGRIYHGSNTGKYDDMELW